MVEKCNETRKNYIEEIYLAAQTSGIEDLEKVNVILLATTWDITILETLETLETAKAKP